MKITHLLSSLFLALTLLSPASRATLIGYNVGFQNFSTADFLNVSSGSGMIFVDPAITTPGNNVDRWMFDVSWENSLLMSSGSDRFSGDNCLSQPSTPTCNSTGLLFDPLTMALTGGVSNTSNNDLLFKSMDLFEFTIPVPNTSFGFATSGGIILSAKPAPEPASMFLLGFGLLLSFTCTRWRRFKPAHTRV